MLVVRPARGVLHQLALTATRPTKRQADLKQAEGWATARPWAATALATGDSKTTMSGLWMGCSARPRVCVPFSAVGLKSLGLR